MIKDQLESTSSAVDDARALLTSWSSNILPDSGRSKLLEDLNSGLLVNCTVNRGQNKIAASVLNKTGKYRLAKKIHETERDRKIIFADRVEGHSDIWEENYYVETHYSTKDIFGNDEVLAQGLRCKCAIG